MVAISGEFGLKGECAVLKLLCAIFKDGYFLEWNELTRGAILRKLPGVSPALFDDILRRLVRWGYFDKSLFDSMGVITSEEVQRIYFEATKRRLDTGEELPHLLIATPSKKVNVDRNRVNVDNNSVNVDINTQSKVKKIKELSKESKKSPPARYDGEMELEECFREISGDRNWIDTLTMNYHKGGHPEFTPDTIREYLSAFLQRLQNEGVKTKSPSDAKSHFSRWLQIRIENENDKRHTTKQQANAAAAQELYAYCAEAVSGGAAR